MVKVIWIIQDNINHPINKQIGNRVVASSSSSSTEQVITTIVAKNNTCLLESEC